MEMISKLPRPAYLLILEIILIQLAIIFPDVVPSLIFIGILFGIMAFDPFLNIFIMLFYLVVQYPIPSFSLGTISIAPMQVMIAISYFYFVLDIIYKGNTKFSKFKTPFFYWFIAFFGISLLSVLWAASKVDSIRYLRDMFFWALFAFYAVYHIQTHKDFKRIIDYWIYAAVLAGILAFIQLIFRVDYFFMVEHRWFVPTNRFFFRLNGTFEDPNLLGNFLVAPLIISLSRIIFSKEKNQIWQTSIIFLALLLTNSRGALISVIAVFAFILVIAFFRKGESKKLIIYTFGIIVLFGIIIYLLPNSVIKRFMPDAYDVDWASLIRLFYIYISIKVIQANFLFGVGINNFPVVFKNYTPDAIWQSLTLGETKGVLHGGGYVHNTFLTIWSETGVLNVLIIAFFFFISVRLLLQLRKSWYKGWNEAGIYMGVILAIFGLLFHLLTITYVTYHIFLAMFLLINIYSFYQRLIKTT